MNSLRGARTDVSGDTSYRKIIERHGLGVRTAERWRVASNLPFGGSTARIPTNALSAICRARFLQI